VTRRPRLKIRSQVYYLPDDQIEALNRLSRQTERSKSDLVREAVAVYLERL
jgi:predicted DNA-binding protein